MGSTRSHRALIERLCSAFCGEVLSLDYSLAPESPFLSAVNNVLQLYKRSLTGGLLLRQIAISGDSTGDGLALETLINIREEGLPPPACAILISPWTDLTVSSHSIKTLAAVDPIVKKEALTEFSAMYLNGALATILLESPLYASLHQLPSILIQVGAAEILLDDTLRLQSKLEAASNNVEVQVWKKMLHVWHLYALILDKGVEAIV